MKINIKEKLKEKDRSLVDKFTSITISITIFISFFLSLYQYYCITVFVQQYNTEREKRYSIYSNLITDNLKSRLATHNIKSIEEMTNKLKSENVLISLSIIDNKTKKLLWTSLKNKKNNTITVDSTQIYNQLKKDMPLLKEDNIVVLYNSIDDYTAIIGLYDNNSIPVISKSLFEGNIKLIILFIIFSIISAIILFRLVSKPIKDLVKGTEEFAKGNLDYRIKISTKDEIGKLADSFNTMAEKLSVLYTSLEQRVKDRTKEIEMANIELQGAYKQLQETQSMLIHNEKMQSLGQLVAGVAHEINNPINFIYGNLDHLKNYCNDLTDIIDAYEKISSELTEESLDEINQLKNDIDYKFLLEDLPALIKSCKEGAERCKQIVLDLKNFSRLDEAVLKDVDIHEGIDSTLNILNNKIKNRINVHKEYSELPKLACYAGQINQVFMNILDNASQAIDGKGDIYIRTSYINDEIVVEFEDTGKGIDKENLSRVFDPFYTTKPVGEGTGIGLSISFKVIKTHNGTISVESEKGKGTKFTVKIPVNWYKNNKKQDLSKNIN